jgi:squalene/oxidosqualene cyclase-like protein
MKARDRAIASLIALQKADGGWEGEMVWNTMILSQYVIVMKAVGRSLDEKTRDKMIRHYRVTRTKEGGWGMHGESPPYVFFTSLAYVALRLLGLPPEDPLCAEARTWLRNQPGGVLYNPTWGKFWLALCGLYEYEGVNPFPPEIFLLPEWIPVAPRNFYCHTRYIYLGIAYLYGRRFRLELGPIVEDLRRELYPGPYSEIDFSQYRHFIAKSDLHVAPSAGLRAAYDLLYGYEKKYARSLKWLREAALGYCFDRIRYEQRASRYQGLSPVNGLLNCLALYAHSPHHPDLGPSLHGIESWKWEDEAEGIRYCGAHSNSWDTAFAMQALCEYTASKTTDPAAQRHATASLALAHRHLLSLQLQEELPHREVEGRQAIRGGWCFSDGQHRWPVSDCTAESLVALFRAESLCGPAIEQPISRQRIEEAVRFLLDRQNADGGFGTYERRRGSTLLEHINPSEMYGNCMTERSYLECTASSLRGLGAVRERQLLGPALSQAVDQAIERGTTRLSAAQRPDGSFPGFWGINFTYAIFHIVTAFRAVGIPATDARLQRAAQWLIEKQRSDGGWGEHYTSCLIDRYVEHSESQVVMTSWALLALLELESAGLKAGSRAIDAGVAFLARTQLSDGSFPQQAQNGVFFGTAMLDYRYYKSYFPTWALSRYLSPNLAPSQSPNQAKDTATATSGQPFRI